MKQLLTLVLTIPLLSIWGCAPPPPAPQQVTANTTNTFDGTYGNAVASPSAGTPMCPYLHPLPVLTITNGLAVWQGPNLSFQGSVTPQGALVMNSSTGQTFQGQVDPSAHALRAHVAGPNCAYDVAWARIS
jgi:hypothetical protein